MNTTDRLQRIEDELEIIQLRARYCHHLDDFEWDKFLELFTDDGEFRGLSVARGQQELKEFFTKTVPLMQDRFWHFCTNGTVSIDGDTATGRITMEFLSTTAGKSYVSAGHYDDVMHRTAKGWKFKSRAITFYFYSPFNEGFTGKPPETVKSVQEEIAPTGKVSITSSLRQWLGNQFAQTSRSCESGMMFFLSR